MDVFLTYVEFLNKSYLPHEFLMQFNSVIGAIYNFIF